LPIKFEFNILQEWEKIQVRILIRNLPHATKFIKTLRIYFKINHDYVFKINNDEGPESTIS